MKKDGIVTEMEKSCREVTFLNPTNMKNSLLTVIEVHMQ
jgi:hypothetical protein